jgi:hypothetical protein
MNTPPAAHDVYSSIMEDRMTLNHPEATQAALSILRSGNVFQWHIMTLLALIFYIYFSEIKAKNWRGIAAGLSLYMVHWLCEIINGLIQHFSGHALWTVPSGTSFLLLIGVGIELSMMFSISGIIFSKVLPDDPSTKILGVNVGLLNALGCAAFAAIFEIFLVKTPAFVWIYPWWGALPVFLTVYIPFFAVSFYCYYWKPRTQFIVVSGLFALNAAALAVFAGILHWI